MGSGRESLSAELQVTRSVRDRDIVASTKIGDLDGSPEAGHARTLSDPDEATASVQTETEGERRSEDVSDELVTIYTGWIWWCGNSVITTPLLTGKKSDHLQGG
jgi:hypothetical protein